MEATVGMFNPQINYPRFLRDAPELVLNADVQIDRFGEI
jgi:hypothetical protein